MEFPSVEMEALRLAGVGFASEMDETAGLAPTDTGLVPETTGMAPHARICIAGPGPGNPLDRP